MHIHELPQTGDELEVIEYYGDDVTEYRFAWDGSKFGLSKKNTQCYDCGPVEIEGEYYIQVPFEGKSCWRNARLPLNRAIRGRWMPC